MGIPPSRAGKRLFALLLATAAGLLACAKPQPPPPVVNLVMPAPTGFDIQVIEHKSVVSDPGTAQGSESTDVAFLRQESISSSAYFKYKLPKGASYKVKMNVFTDRAALQRHWQRRYPEAIRASGQPLAGVDDGFQLPDRAAAFAKQGVMVEIEAADGAPRLAEFTQAYIEYLDRRLR